MILRFQSPVHVPNFEGNTPQLERELRTCATGTKTTKEGNNQTRRHWQQLDTAPAANNVHHIFLVLLGVRVYTIIPDTSSLPDTSLQICIYHMLSTKCIM